MNKDVRVSVLNVPEYASNYKWWVVRFAYGYLYFFGGFDDENRAIEASNSLDNGMVIENV